MNSKAHLNQIRARVNNDRDREKLSVAMYEVGDLAYLFEVIDQLRKELAEAKVDNRRLRRDLLNIALEQQGMG